MLFRSQGRERERDRERAYFLSSRKQKKATAVKLAEKRGRNGSLRRRKDSLPFTGLACRRANGRLSAGGHFVIPSDANAVCPAMPSVLSWIWFSLITMSSFSVPCHTHTHTHRERAPITNADTHPHHIRTHAYDWQATHTFFQ